MDPSDRQTVQAQQKLLIRALVSSANAAPGFDPDRLELAGRMLRNKRFRAARRAFPDLFRALGNHCAEEFDTYAKVSPLPTGGASVDAIEFARGAGSRRNLSIVWRLRLLVARISNRHQEKRCEDEGA